MSLDERCVSGPWLSLPQAATYVGVAESQISRARRLGAVAAYRLGYRTFVYNRHDLDEWVRSLCVPVKKRGSAAADVDALVVPLPAKRPRRRVS